MVEYGSIGSLLKRKRNKAKNEKLKAPVYAVTNNSGFVLSSSLHDFTIHSEDTSNYMVVEKNDFAYNPSRLNIGSIAYFDNEGKGLISPMYVVFHADEKKVLPQYLFVVIKSEEVRNKIDSLKEVGARFRFDFSRWNLIQIPIPSLSEQTRIVGILDTFTASIDNLKEQIAQRRKQYEYYRDQLLDLEGKPGVEMKTLGELCKIKNGYTPSTKEPSYWENGTLPWFTLEDIRINGRILKDAIKHITPLGVKRGGLFPKGSVIVSTTATIGEYALIETAFLCNQQITCISIKDSYKNILSEKFLYHLSQRIGEWCKKNVNGGGSLLIVSTSKLNKLQIPLPPLSEQRRIVTILDTFETSIQNLESQLTQREKQYEYYRNKLLTFE